MNALDQPKTAQLLDRLVWVLTAVVYVVVVTLHKFHFPLPESVDLTFLPAFNAICNTGVTVALVLAIVYVKQGKFQQHANMIQVAMALSAIFLVSYIVYNSTNASTPHGGEGLVKTLYYILLISHILLAAISLPFILKAYVYAITKRIDSHKKVVKWAFPLWLFVAVTGPICYLMLKPYY